ncbi:MAG: hypothetical protein GY708_02550 [Actinomycetia bacterium]|nr:hypothetical protein [Actinomycetes bacterium]
MKTIERSTDRPVSIPAPTTGVVLLLVLGLVAGACTSTSDATDRQPVSPTSGAAGSGDSTEGSAIGDLTLDGETITPIFGTIAPSAPRQLILASHASAGVFDLTSGDFNTIAMPVALEIGHNPEEAERIVAASSGDGGRLVVEVEPPAGDRITRIVSPDGANLLELPGSRAAVDAAGRRVALAQDDAITITDLTARVTGEGAILPGRVTSMSWSPDGENLAIGWRSIDDTGVMFASVDGSEVREMTQYPKPLSAEWHHPVWMTDRVLAVIEQELNADPTGFSGWSADGSVLLVIADVERDERLHTSRLPEGVISLDAAPDGTTLAIVTASGELLWWSEGSMDRLHDGPWLSARW